MKFILIAVLTASSYPTVVEFDDKQACVAAAETLKPVVKSVAAGSINRAPTELVFCVAKGSSTTRN